MTMPAFVGVKAFQVLNAIKPVKNFHQPLPLLMEIQLLIRFQFYSIALDPVNFSILAASSFVSCVFTSDVEAIAKINSEIKPFLILIFFFIVGFRENGF